MSNPPHRAVIIGASQKPERHSYLCVVRLAAAGWLVEPVHPSGLAIAGHPCHRDLSTVGGPVDLVSVYLNPRAGADLLAAIAALQPRRVILNPGADGEPMLSACRNAGLPVEEACTLVLLAAGQLPAEGPSGPPPTTRPAR